MSHVNWYFQCNVVAETCAKNIQHVERCAVY